MKKWYQPCGWMLVAALTCELSGCAQGKALVGRFSSKDRADQKLVDVEGKTRTKTASDKTASSEKSAKEEKDGVFGSLFAKKPKAKPKAHSRDSSSTKIASKDGASSTKTTPKKDVASTKDVASAKEPQKARESRDPFLTEEFDALAAKDTAIAKKKTATTRTAGIEETDESDFGREIAQTSAKGSQKPDANQAAVQRGSRIQEATHQVEDDLATLPDLPEWAIEDEAPRAKKEIQRTARPAASAFADIEESTRKQLSSAEDVRRELEQTLKEPAPASPAAAAVAKSSTVALLSLCPDAQGDLREQIRGLNSSDIEGLKRGIHRIGRMGTDAAAAAPALEHLLKHKDGFVRTHAALALTRTQQSTPEAIKTVVEGLKSSDPGLRSFAAAVLAEMGPQAGDALAALADSLDDRDGYVRLHAAEVLIRYEDWSYRALDTLLGCLKDKDENVRWLATYSLAELAPESAEAVTALIKTVHDPVIKVQTGAVYALGEIGPFAKAAGPHLHRLADDTPHAELQSAIVYALQQIEQ